MATTYKKALKTIVVKTIGGASITVADTATDPKASDALSAFMNGNTMHIRTAENKVTLVPFHAVDNIVVTSAVSEDITKKDPYCAE